jgi:predicted anti-sigma-YlaC factor YlaD
MSRSCGEAQLSLGAYLLGALARADRAHVDSHLRTCADCRAELDYMDALPGLLDRVDESEIAWADPSPELLDRVLSAVAAERRPLPPTG